ncbi:hypothetical protein DFP72DRAFT_1060207 [Ephemerocybe angulata]|uniref:Uncharacterized protein n=1 Tax=Ephemerocybe angulata TaxID=980116 RepID=A0A8H6MFA1_9AGAR|nr:hypothetical protein DFP72DRAFT_1060207 [Tulosesus angulatus]
MQLNLVHPDQPISAVTPAEYEAGKAWIVDVRTCHWAMTGFRQRMETHLSMYLEQAHTKFDTKELPFDSMADDIAVCYGNHAPYRGKKTVGKLFEWQFRALEKFEHTIEFGKRSSFSLNPVNRTPIAVLVMKEGIIVQNQATYLFTNGKKVNVKVIGMYAKSVNSSQATEFHLHGDFCEVFENLVSINGAPDF